MCSTLSSLEKGDPSGLLLFKLTNPCLINLSGMRPISRSSRQGDDEIGNLVKCNLNQSSSIVLVHFSLRTASRGSNIVLPGIYSFSVASTNIFSRYALRSSWEPIVIPMGGSIEYSCPHLLGLKPGPVSLLEVPSRLGD